MQWHYVPHPGSGHHATRWLPGGLNLPEGTTGGGANASALIKAGAQVWGPEESTEEWRQPGSSQHETWKMSGYVEGDGPRMQRMNRKYNLNIGRV